MNAFKKILIAVLLAVIVLSGVGGVFWHSQHYLMIDSQLYSKDAQTLDLRGEKISIKQYERFRENLPDCDIVWNVPFQEGYYPEDTRKLTITRLSEKDIEVLDYLTELETIDASGCTDYDLLLSLQDRRPEIDIRYGIQLGGSSYDPDTRELELTAIADKELSRLGYLEHLETIVINGSENMQDFTNLQSYCKEQGLALRIRIGETLVDNDVRSLTVSGMETADFFVLTLLPDLQELHIENPNAPMEILEYVQEAVPELALTWSQEICGSTYSHTETEIDISGNPVENLDDIEWRMDYFPHLQKLIMSDCGIDNETMAEFRERHREDYKVVWTVQLGDKLTARTDDTTFMPVRENVFYFQDHESVNLKYCEDMVCIDVGHMSIHDISFVEYMPNLKYLILAHTEVRDITPLENCKNLVFLELDWSTVRDFTPLLGCTALEDLNVGKTYPDLVPIAQMTWLKNLWMVGRSGGAYEVTQALTNTKIVLSGSATVAGGWRELPNYYAMRDLLEMPYMTW